MLYGRTLLFIHPIYNSLHLLIPDSQSIPPPWQPQVDTEDSYCKRCMCLWLRPRLGQSASLLNSPLFLLTFSFLSTILPSFYFTVSLPFTTWFSLSVIFEKFFHENCILSHIYIAAYLKVINFAFITSMLSIQTCGSIWLELHISLALGFWTSEGLHLHIKY